MSTHKISWLNIPGYKGETWNPIIGCTKVSEGCANCWAEVMANRLSGMPYTKENYSKVITDGKWNGKTTLCHNQLNKPLEWKKPRAVAVCLEGDMFHESVPFEWIRRVFVSMLPNNNTHWVKHLFLILTKRPERMKEFFEWNEKQFDFTIEWPLDNVWLGVTAENQEQANKRIPILLSIPAAKRFVSIEPMLGEINLGVILHSEAHIDALNGLYNTYPDGFWRQKQIPKLDWVIVGGESGSKARPMPPDWVRSLQKQCEEAQVPFFFKQWGEYKDGSEFSKTCFNAIVFNDGSYVQDYSTDLDAKLKSMTPDKWNTMHPTVMARIGRKAAGYSLDGKEYHQFPKTSL